MLRATLITLAVILAVLMIVALPSIRRYLRIRSM